MTLADLVDRVVLPLLGAAVLLVVWRALRGPTAADRIVALDTLAATGVGLACALAVRSGQVALGDVVLVLSLVVFLATLAWARYLERNP